MEHGANHGARQIDSETGNSLNSGGLKQNVDLGIWHRLTQLMVGLVVLASLLGIFFWYLPLFQQNARMRKQIMVLQGQVRVEERKQEAIKTAISHLENDPKTVERMAREKLGYAKPGETVIFFEPPKRSYPVR